jgi:nucleoside-diphosphate-sugar epimerase
MRIFVAGASGAIGVQLLPILVADGHAVAGTTRSPAKAERIAELGAEPVVCDVYEATGLTEAVTTFRADAVIHELTDLPSDPAGIAEAAPVNNRLRREGTRNLLDAARAAGASRFLAQSVAFELSGDSGAAIAEHEAAVLDAGGVVLRYGYFYGPGTYHEHDKAPPPSIHVADAARQTADALEAPSGILTVVDPD